MIISTNSFVILFLNIHTPRLTAVSVYRTAPRKAALPRRAPTRVPRRVPRRVPSVPRAARPPKKARQLLRAAAAVAAGMEDGIGVR